MAPFAQAAFTAPQLTGGSAASGTIWREVSGNYDFNTDQQTGQPQCDIIGTVTDPGFYTAYDTNGTTGTYTDDFIAFRVRLNDQNGTKSYFGANLWIGIAADGDNNIDAYISYTASASGPSIAIYSPGDGLNNSPNTTTVTAPVNTAAYTWTNAAYHNYRAVSWGPGLDGGTTNNAGLAPGTDLNNDTNPDWYASIQIPFISLVNFLADPIEMTGTSNQPITGITDQSALRFLLGTSTQGNSFNQDIGGVDGDSPTYNAALTWDQQPGSPLSQPFNSLGVIPEPSSSLLAMLSGLVLLMRRRRN